MGAAGEFEDQLDAAAGGVIGALWVDAAFEAVGTVRGKAEFAGSEADGFRLNHAASKTMSVVLSSTSASMLPMIPARTSGRSASAITCISGVNLRSLSSRVVRVSPTLALRTRICLPLSVAASKAWRELPSLHQDPVGDVDDVVDRAQTDGLNIFLEPLRAGGDFDAADAVGGVVRAEVFFLDGDTFQ